LLVALEAVEHRPDKFANRLNLLAIQMATRRVIEGIRKRDLIGNTPQVGKLIGVRRADVFAHGRAVESRGDRCFAFERGVNLKRKQPAPQRLGAFAELLVNPASPVAFVQENARAVATMRNERLAGMLEENVALVERITRIPR